MAGTDRLPDDASLHAIAGALGGLLSLGVFYPLDVLRSLVQLDDPRVRGGRKDSVPAKDISCVLPCLSLFHHLRPCT